MSKFGYVYILSNKHRNVFYTGVTNDIFRRTLEHKAGVGSGFTAQYQTHDLLFFEEIEGFGEAILREKQIKNWRREWKLNLIRVENPDFIDLAKSWFSEEQIEDRRNAKNGDSETSSE